MRLYFRGQAGDSALDHKQVVHHEGQGIVDLVSDSRHQLSQRSHLFVLDQLRLGFFELAIGFLQIVIGLHQLFGHRGAYFGGLPPGKRA